MGNRPHHRDTQIQLDSKHTNLQIAKLVQNKRQLCLKVSYCLDKKDYDRWKQHLKHYQDHPALFLPLEHSFSTTQLCGNAGTVQILYPNYPHLLQQEFITRLQKNHEFTQPQLWYLLLTLIVAKKEAMNSGYMLGDIRPKNILLNQHGRVKVPCLFSWPLEISKYQKMIDNVPTYLSPEELIALENGPIEAAQITEPAEMFGIGLTMLSAANLKDYSALYDCQNLKFDFQQFEQAIRELVVNSRYSQVLRSTITNLCSYQSSRRMALLQLWNLLGPHSIHIMAKTNFVIYNAPQKLHQEVDILRSITNHKTAQLPSELPERTIQGMMSGSPSSVFDKLVPSHLNENTSSAIDTD